MECSKIKLTQLHLSLLLSTLTIDMVELEMKMILNRGSFAVEATEVNFSNESKLIVIYKAERYYQTFLFPNLEKNAE